MRNLWAAVAVVFAFLVIACGGRDGGGKAAGAKTASAVFTVQWSDPNGRFIANRATSVSMAILRKSNFTSSGSGRVDRPGNATTSQIKIADLPSDEPLYITVTAQDSSGTMLSTVSETETLKPGANVLSFTLASVVDSIAITPASPTVAVGATLQLSAVGKSGSATVLSTNSDFVWNSSAPSVASVDIHTGLVTGVMNGTATISAREAGNDFSSAHIQSILVTVGSGGTTGGGTTSGGTFGVGNAIFSWSGQTASGASTTASFATSPSAGSIASQSPFNTITSGVVSLNTATNPGRAVFTNGTDTVTVTFDPAADETYGLSSVASVGIISAGTGVFSPFVSPANKVTVTSQTLLNVGANFFSVLGKVSSVG